MALITTPLLRHQQEVVELVHNKTYYALLWQCGTGKTLGVLSILARRLERFPKYKTLYVCPTTLIENVQDEVQKHTHMSCILLTGTRKQRLVKLDRPAHIYIINYEALRIITQDLMNAQFNCVIFDESQNLKCHTTLQSKAGYKIAMNCPHRLILTGTPIHNGPLDCFGQFRVLSPDIFGPSYYRFRARYALMGGFMNKQVLTYKNMGEFARKIHACSSVKSKEEVLDLPPRTYETVRVALTDEQARMYKDLRTSFLAAKDNHIVTAPVILTRLMRFSQITAGFYKTVDDIEAAYERNPKHEWLIEWIKENQKKVVVFVRFIKELKELEQALTDADIKYVAIHGAVKNRIELVKEFNADDTIQVFIGQIDTAGQGINLQSASYCVFLSNNYSYGDREQAESRIHRAGQLAANCTYIDVVARGTIDDNILTILKRKESLANMVVSDLKRLV